MVGAVGDRTAVALLALLLFSSWYSVVVMGYREREMEGEKGEEEWPFGKREEGQELFLLHESKHVLRTDRGEVRVLKGYRWKGDPNPMHIGFISMEPNTLFIPQYLDSSIILFVRRGEAKVGWIYKDNMVEKQLKMGDINRIPAGSAFYMVNTGKGQRLQIICSIDTSEGLGWDVFQSFYIGGGINPPSVLSGFDMEVLATAFNVTTEELSTVLSRQTGGPIVYVPSEATEHTHWSMQLARKYSWKSYHGDEEEAGYTETLQEDSPWTWRKLLDSLLGKDNQRGLKEKGPVHAPDSYNLFDRDPDFRNNYGWSIALDQHDYAPLKRSDIGVYLVNLTAGSMLAPHVNPRATEYGVVLGGSGTIQVVFPNGTMAMSAKVAEGDVFWIPRYFPFCQIASRSGPFEFFGFTTSARRNRPQFLVGATSVLKTILGPELAVAFGLSEDELRSLVESQNESIILPSWPLPERRKEGGEPLLENWVAGE